jgi:cytidylate kinase
MIIAIDGPAGAGKSTVSKLLAKKLGFLYLDTGAIYRALTLKAIRDNIDINDANGLIDMACNSDINLINNPDGSLKVLLDSEDVSELIRQPNITKVVSDIAKIKGVRQAMLGLQRKLASNIDCVLDGRDIGTVVFPNAEKKFYVDANFNERAMRRHKELIGARQNVTLRDVKNDLQNRDTIDSQREVAPLKKADDAIYVDTTNMSIEQVVDKLFVYVSE